MKSVFTVVVAVLALCVGCSSKPGDTDIGGVLMENLPKSLKTVVSIEQTQTEVTGRDDDLLVTFKARLKLSQPLFETVDFGSVANITESDIALFPKIEQAALGLTPESRDDLARAIKAATSKPVFIRQTASAGDATDWYGSFKDRKVVDKWVSSAFKVEVEPTFKGFPRVSFEEAAVEITQAKAWFAEIMVKQADVLQKIEAAKLIAQKDVEIEQTRALAQKQLAQKDNEIALAKASTKTEREAKEALLTVKRVQEARLPVVLSMKRALIGDSLTLVIQSTQAMTIRLEVSRGLQRFAHDYQLTGGRPKVVGHMEGWGFVSGDLVRLSNPLFDTKVITIP